MAIQELRTCDVYGTTKEVGQFELTVYRCGNQVFCIERDLSPRAMRRLAKFIARGVSKAGNQDAVNKAEDEMVEQLDSSEWKK